MNWRVYPSNAVGPPCPECGVVPIKGFPSFDHERDCSLRPNPFRLEEDDPQPQVEKSKPRFGESPRTLEE